MIFYHLPTSSLSNIFNFDNEEAIKTFPFRYQNEVVEACCLNAHGKCVVVDVNMKKMIREYNIPDLKEIGCMVSSLSTLWIMDRWTRKIYTITEEGEPKETEIGTNFGKKLRAVDIATYTDHAIILMEDVNTGETYLFGYGSKEHGRFGEKIDLSQPIFIPHEELDPSSRITHISCCYSYSVCVINNRDIHMAGQDWISRSFHPPSHKWKKLVYRCPEDVFSLKSGNFFFVAVLKNFHIVSGGSNASNETTQPKNQSGVNVNEKLGFSVVSASLGSYLTLLKSKSGSYHIYGRTTAFCNSERQLLDRICLQEDQSRTIPYDEVFIERDAEVMHYKDNSALMIMYSTPCLIRYSQVPTPNCQFQILPNGIVFYSKGANNFQQALHSTLQNPKSVFISDISLNVA